MSIPLTAPANPPMPTTEPTARRGKVSETSSPCTAPSLISSSPLFNWNRRLHRRDGRPFEIPTGKHQKGRPVGSGRVPSAKLAEGHLTIDERRLHRRKLGRSHVFLAQQLVHRPGAGSRQKHALSVHPCIPFS